MQNYGLIFQVKIMKGGPVLKRQICKRKQMQDIYVYAPNECQKSFLVNLYEMVLYVLLQSVPFRGTRVPPGCLQRQIYPTAGMWLQITLVSESENNYIYLYIYISCKLGAAQLEVGQKY